MLAIDFRSWASKQCVVASIHKHHRGNLAWVMGGLLALGICASAALADPGRSSRASEAVAARSQPGDQQVVDLTRIGGPSRVSLRRSEIRSSNFRVLVSGPGGKPQATTVPPTRIYRGSAEVGDEFVVTLDEHGEPMNFSRFSSLPERELPATPTLTQLRTAEVLSRKGLRAQGLPPGRGPDGSYTLAPEVVPTGMQELEIGIDCDVHCFRAHGSSMETTVAEIERRIAENDLIYARDLMVTFKITEIVVRTEPYYDPTYAPKNTSEVYSAFIEEWQGNVAQTYRPRDQTHLLTANPMWDDTGGLAGLGDICGPGYSAEELLGDPIGKRPEASSHEIGHSVGADHCHDASPCSILCQDRCRVFGPNTKNRILGFLSTTQCLAAAGPYATAVRPFASEDRVVKTREELANGGPVTIDVLANDHDANLDALTLSSFDSKSPGGSSIARQGSGLSYAPASAGPPARTEAIQYTASDSTGRQATSTASIAVAGDLRLAGYWPMDEADGNVLEDLSGHDHSGLLNESTRVPGRFNGGIRAGEFTEGFAVVPLPKPIVHGNEASFSLWARLEEVPTDDAALFALVARDEQVSLAEVFVTSERRLAYRWGTTVFVSEIKVPLQEWVFLALVVSPDRAVLALRGERSSSASNIAAHEALSLEGSLFLAGKRWGSSTNLVGAIDDMRVYSQTLFGLGLDLVIRRGAVAGSFDPRPAVGGLALVSKPKLSWKAQGTTQLFDVYFGTDYKAVRDAGRGSPTYQGQRSERFFRPSSDLEEGVEYFWRVDRVSASFVGKGEVWQFRRASLLRHLPLDDAAGPDVVDAAGAESGRLEGTPKLGQPGATSSSGSSLLVEGNGQGVVAPPLGLETDSLTITGWLRRDGRGLAPFIPLVVAGAAGGQRAALGLITNSGPATLVYEWGGESGTLVADQVELPNDEWTFVALVVEPDRATLYRSVDGVLVAETKLGDHERLHFDQDLTLGFAPAESSSFAGQLDDIRIYKGSLRASEIRELAARGGSNCGLLGIELVLVLILRSARRAFSGTRRSMRSR